MSLVQLTRWWDSAWPRLGQRQSHARDRAKPRTSFRPQIVGLEDRCLLCTVTNLMDSGPGSLRQCIIDAPTAGTVDFQDGLSGTITLTSAPLTVNKILTIAGPGADVITVSGNHARQVFIIPAPWTVNISGLAIAYGSISGGSTDANGGGISNGGALFITGCTLSGNSAIGPFGSKGDGGAIYNTGTLTFTSSILITNSASGSLGGNGGGIFNTGTLTVTSSTISANSVTAGASGGQGGGIFNTGTLTVTSSTISANSVAAGNTRGGGIYNTGTAGVTGSTLSGNSAGDQGGGGIFNGGGTLTVTSSTLTANSASGSGGGINKTGGGNVTIISSTFNLNAAATGAGISHIGTGMITLTSSTLSNNFASSQGGGISHTGTGMITLTSSTLSGNFASSQGGGIFHTGSGTLVTRNTIIAGNSAPTSSVDVMGALASQGYNLIGNGTGGSGYSDTDLVGTAAMPIDPLLDALGDYGGPTQTMRLQVQSPALDAGDPTQLGMADQRGVVRTCGVNIGAFQASATVFQVTAKLPAPHSTVAGTAFDLTLAAFDPYQNPAIGYTCTVHFSSADPYGATLPPNYTFTADDAGVHTFAPGAALYTAGTWDVSARDTDDGSITGTTPVRVRPAPVSHFQIIAPPRVTPGVAFSVTVRAEDPYGNVNPHYHGTMTWTSTDANPGVVLPADSPLKHRNHGQATFAGGVTLITPGHQTLTVTDPSSGITGSLRVTVRLPDDRPSGGSPRAEALAGVMTDAPPVRGSAVGGRLESEDVNGTLPAQRQGDRLVAFLRARPVDLGPSNGSVTRSDDSSLTLPAGAVDGVFARMNLDPAFIRAMDDSADMTTMAN